MRLINGDATVDAVDKRIRQIGYKNDPLVLSIRQAVREVKPVDAVPVVRCKDCKHHHYEKHFDKRIPYCDRIDYGYGWQDNDFCSRGERKDGEHDTGRTEQAAC